jgi:L-threonylcarbamoyladenylate synthase
MTVLAFRSEHDWAEAIEPVRHHLVTGHLLAYPTETVYGLGSRPDARDLIALSALKQRATGKPFLLLVGSRAMAQAWGLTFTPAAKTLADSFWPGPLTLVLRCGEGRLPAGLRGEQGGIAVRWTSHQGIETLVNGLEYPLTSTSANREGGTPASQVDTLMTTFGGAIENGTLLVLDGGAVGDTPPSTIVDCTNEPPRVIRTGAIPVDELRAVVGSLTS